MMTAGNDYGVRVITAYENKRVGQVFFPPALLRDRLVKTGRVERVKAPEPVEDTEVPRGKRKQPRAAPLLTE